MTKLRHSDIGVRAAGAVPRGLLHAGHARRRFGVRRHAELQLLLLHVGRVPHRRRSSQPGNRVEKL